MRFPLIIPVILISACDTHHSPPSIPSGNSGSRFQRDKPWIEKWLPDFETHWRSHPHIIRMLSQLLSPIVICGPIYFSASHESKIRQFDQLQVRILKLENTGQNRTIVSAMIDSADIWECLVDLGACWCHRNAMNQRHQTLQSWLPALSQYTLLQPCLQSVEPHL